MQRVLSFISQNAFLRNSAILFVGSMVGNVFNYIFHLVTGRMVEPHTYGEIESLISFLTIMSVPAGTLILVATKYAATYKGGNDKVGTSVLLQYLHRKIFTYGLPLLFLAFLMTPFVKEFLNIQNTHALFLVWLAMFLSFLSAVTTGVLSGWQKFVHTSVAGIISTALKLGVAVGFLILGFEASGIIGSYVIAALCAYVIMLFSLQKFFPKDAVSEKDFSLPFSSIKSYVLPAFYGTLALAILGNVDMIFAQRVLASGDAGEYGALSIVAKTIFFVTGVLTTVLFAMSAEENGQSGNSLKTLKLASLATFLVSLSGIVAFSLFPAFIMELLFGEKYVAVSHFLGWFALIAGLYSFANLFLQYLLSMNEHRGISLFLALAGLEIVTLFFFGQTFYAIIGLTLIFQLLAVVMGFCFIATKKPHV